MKKLILLSGKKTSGKSLSGKLIKQLEPTAKLMAFATPLKAILAKTLGIPMAQLEEWKELDYVSLQGIPREDQEDTSFEMQSYRQMLQNIGDGLKEQFGQDVFSKLAVQQINGYFSFTDIVVITDWRYREEFNYIYDAFVEDQESQGHIFDRLTIDLYAIRVDREGLDLFDGHSSEVQLDDFEFDYRVTNNGTTEDLKQKLKGILDEY